MITDLLVTISHFITSTIDQLGYVGVVLLMGMGTAAIPLPSELVMTFAGSLVEDGRFSLLSLALAGAIGSTLGSLDRKSTRLNSSHSSISYAVFCLKKKT